MAERDRDEVFVEYTKSICPMYKVVVDAQVNIRDDKAFLRRRCREHGQFEALVYGDAPAYLASAGSNKLGTIPPPVQRSYPAFHPDAVAPLVTLAHGLSDRESQVTRLCMEGLSTRWRTPSPYRRTLSRPSQIDLRKDRRPKPQRAGRPDLPGALVPRWEDIADVPAGWLAKASAIPAGVDSGPSPRAAMLA